MSIYQINEGSDFSEGKVEMTPGIHKATLVGINNVTAKTGTNGIEFIFNRTNADGVEEELRTSFWFTEAAIKSSFSPVGATIHIMNKLQIDNISELIEKFKGSKVIYSDKKGNPRNPEINDLMEIVFKTSTTHESIVEKLNTILNSTTCSDMLIKVKKDYANKEETKVKTTLGPDRPFTAPLTGPDSKRLRFDPAKDIVKPKEGVATGPSFVPPSPSNLPPIVPTVKQVDDDIPF